MQSFVYLLYLISCLSAKDALALLRAEPLDVININLNLIPFNSQNSGQNSLKRRTTVKKIKYAGSIITDFIHLSGGDHCTLS